MLDVPRASALIVSYNTRDLLLEAIGSLANEPDVEIIVFDNASHDGSADAVAEHFPSVRLVRSTVNVGFAAGMNGAATCALGEALLLFNPDATLAPGAFGLLLDFLDRTPRAGLVAPALRYPSGDVQPAAFRFPGVAQVALDLFPLPRLMNTSLNGRIAAHTPVRIDHPLGACMLIRRAAWDDVGPLDEGYFMYLEEIDWSMRAKLRGWQIWYEPRAVAVHHGGQSTRQKADLMFAQLWRSRLRYYQRYAGPTYNRLLHALVRLGLSRATRAQASRAADLGPVRRLTQ